MSKIKNGFRILGEIASAYGEHQMKVDTMTNDIMSRTYNVDPAEARKIAEMLVNRAEVTWK
jgi:uncharacterized protein